MKSKTICILLADGFEEVEAIYPADIFKRLGLNVIMAGIESNSVRGAHDINIEVPYLINDISIADFDALMLPGGLPGTINLRNSSATKELLQQASTNKKIIAAICAAPIVLHDAGIATNKITTGYPKSESLAKKNDFTFSGKNIEIDDNIITAIGMGQASNFAFAIAQSLGVDQSKIQDVAKNAFIDFQK